MSCPSIIPVRRCLHSEVHWLPQYTASVPAVEDSRDWRGPTSQKNPRIHNLTCIAKFFRDWSFSFSFSFLIQVLQKSVCPHRIGKYADLVIPSDCQNKQNKLLKCDVLSASFLVQLTGSGRKTFGQGKDGPLGAPSPSSSPNSAT